MLLVAVKVICFVQGAICTTAKQDLTLDALHNEQEHGYSLYRVSDDREIEVGFTGVHAFLATNTISGLRKRKRVKMDY